MDKINKFDYNIIKWIEDNLRNNVLDIFFKVITELGDKMVFIGIVMVLFWVVNKRFAYKFLFAFIGSALINQVLKVIIARPRPFTEPGISSVGKESSGYSFPSGHSQSTAIIYYAFNEECGKKNKIVKGILIALLILIPFSRMYLGQHYLTDVVVGVIVGLVSAYLIYKLFDLFKDKEHIYPLYGIPLVVILLLFFINKDYSNYQELFVAGGGYVGFSIGYFIEKLYIKHNVETTLVNKLLKLLIGVTIVAIFYFGLSALFKGISPENLMLDFLRYTVVGLAATTLVPYLFTLIFKE